MRNIFPDKLRRLPYRLRKRISGSGWLVPQGPHEKSIDRTYPTVGAMLGSGTDPQTEHDEAKSAQGGLEEVGLGGTIPTHFQLDGREDTLDSLNQAFINGFLDELEKQGSVIEHAADMIKDVKGRMVAGHKERGITGAAIGLEKGLRANPWLWLGPAGAYAGYRLLKGVLSLGKDDEQQSRGY